MIINLPEQFQLVECVLAPAVKLYPRTLAHENQLEDDPVLGVIFDDED
jgi:hypothetical protein